VPGPGIGAGLAGGGGIAYMGAAADGRGAQDCLPPAFPPEMRTEMARITYIAADGSRYEVEAENGSTVMENAIRNGVPGIEAECGGACACATCHVYVDEAFKEIVGEPEPMEEDMLDFAFDVRPTSRLSCQIRVRDELDGLTVTVPDRQG
jgi:2Fe-2S ferredoxin